ncbi:hypothetical protein D3C84_628640 [compost metagenome]
MGPVHWKGKVGTEKRDALRAHLHRQIHGRVNHAAAHVQLRTGMLFAQRGVDRACGVTTVTLAFPGIEHLWIAQWQVHQRNILGRITGQVQHADALVDAHDQVRLDSVLAKGLVGRVHTDEQRSRGLVAHRCQALEIPFQARPGGNHINLTLGTSAKQPSHIVVGKQ